MNTQRINNDISDEIDTIAKMKLLGGDLILKLENVAEVHISLKNNLVYWGYKFGLNDKNGARWNFHYTTGLGYFIEDIYEMYKIKI